MSSWHFFGAIGIWHIIAVVPTYLAGWIQRQSSQDGLPLHIRREKAEAWLLTDGFVSIHAWNMLQ